MQHRTAAKHGAGGVVSGAEQYPQPDPLKHAAAAPTGFGGIALHSMLMGCLVLVVCCVVLSTGAGQEPRDQDP